MRLLLSLCLLPLTVLAAQTEGPLPTQVQLIPGGQKVLTVPGLTRLAVGNADVADIKALGNNQVLLVGRAPGETTVRIWRQGGSAAFEIKLQVAKGHAPVVAPVPVTISRPAPASASGEEELTLVKGEKRVLALRGISRIAVGDPEIADVELLGNDKLLLKAGKQVGGTSVIVWMGEERKSFLVHVGN
jgi:Flp pilus assembly secretin CpaC